MADEVPQHVPVSSLLRCSCTIVMIATEGCSGRRALTISVRLSAGYNLSLLLHHHDQRSFRNNVGFTYCHQTRTVDPWIIIFLAYMESSRVLLGCSRYVSIAVYIGSRRLNVLHVIRLLGDRSQSHWACIQSINRLPHQLHRERSPSIRRGKELFPDHRSFLGCSDGAESLPTSSPVTPNSDRPRRSSYATDGRDARSPGGHDCRLLHEC